MKYWIFIAIRDMFYPVLVCSSEKNLMLDEVRISSRISNDIKQALGNDIGRLTYAVCCKASMLPYPFFMIFNSARDNEEEMLDMMFVDSYETMFNWSEKSVTY